MKFLKALLMVGLLLPFTAKAGGSSGGTPPAMQLETMVLSERVLTSSELAKFSGTYLGRGSSLAAEKTQVFSLRAMPRKAMMEILEPAGVLVEVMASGFESLAENAERGSVIFYHEAETEVSAINHDTSTVILKMRDDPAVMIVVQPDTSTVLAGGGSGGTPPALDMEATDAP